MFFQKFIPKRLNAQIILLSALALTVTITVYVSMMIQERYKYLLEDSKTYVELLTKSIATATSTPLIFNDLASVEEELMIFAGFPNVRSIQIYDAEGKPLSNVRQDKEGKSQLFFSKELLSIPSVIKKQIILNNENQISIIWPIESGEVLGWIKLKYCLDKMQEQQSVFIQKSAAAGVVIILISISLLNILLRRPLRIIQTIKDFSKKLIKYRGIQIPVNESVLEFKELAEALNNMSRELEQKETSLQVNKNRLEAILKSAPDGIITANEKGIIESFNPAAEKIFGYSAEEIIGKNLNILMPEPYTHQHDGYMRHYIETGEKKIIGRVGRELEGKNKLGQVFPMELSVTETFIGDKRLFTGIVRDITQRKKVEEELAQHNNYLEGMVAERTAKMEEQVWIANARASLGEQMRQVSSSADLSQKVLVVMAELMHADIGALYLANKDNIFQLMAGYAMTDVSDNRKSFKLGEGLVGQAALEKKVLEFSDASKDFDRIDYGLGSVLPQYFLISPFFFEEKSKGVIVLGTVKQISKERKKFIENIGHDIGIAFDVIQSREKIDILFKDMKEQSEELQSQQEELKAVNEELEEKTEFLENQRNEIIKKNREIEKSREELEIKAKDLEALSRYKSEFLANMSHELRTPLNSLLILASTLKENDEKNLTEDQLESINVIHGSGRDLLALINEILDLSKVEAGKMKAHVEKVEIQELIESMERNFKPVAEQKGIIFKVQCEENLPAFIQTDRQKVEQILKNLLSNAFKFTEKGEVRFSIVRPDKDVDFSHSKLMAEQSIAFEISDDGIGIADDKRHLVFEAFQQVDGTTSRKYGGTGLGLSISKEFAKFLGGDIILHSEEGKGSIFTLCLPEVTDKSMDIQNESSSSSSEKLIVSNVEETSKKEEHLSNRQLLIEDDRAEITEKDKTVLIVEDDPKFLKILLNIIRQKGFKVLAAEDGETGLQLVEQYKPNAIILDIMLPGIDGWAVMNRLKDNPQTRHIPVHFMSALDNEHNPMTKTAIGYLSKPVAKEDLDYAIENIKKFISKDIKKLLIIESKEETQQQIKNLMANDYIEMVMVQTEEEAYEYLQKERFDCMIIDIDVSQTSIIEILERIRKDIFSDYLPVIVYTQRELSKEEKIKLTMYSNSIIMHGEKFQERLLDETLLFLHCVEKDLPETQQQIIREVHDKEAILRGKKILVVDDDMRNTFALSKVLKGKGMDVLLAENGQVAIDVLKEKESQIDIVLMDIMMPVMDGYEAMTSIRTDLKMTQIPILALTAKAMKGDREKCIEAGASDYLTKPVNLEKLFSMLRVWLYS